MYPARDGRDAVKQRCTLQQRSDHYHPFCPSHPLGRLFFVPQSACSLCRAHLARTTGMPRPR